MAGLEKAGAPTNGVSEVQLLTPTPVISGGTWKITYDGQQTAAIQWNAPHADIQAALEALSNVAPGDIAVTGGPISIGVVTLTFGGQLAGLNAPQVTVDVTLLTGIGHALAPSTSVAGVLGSFRGAAPGSVMVDTTNGNAYENTGSLNVPTWVPTVGRGQIVQPGGTEGSRELDGQRVTVSRSGDEQYQIDPFHMPVGDEPDTFGPVTM